MAAKRPVAEQVSTPANESDSTPIIFPKLPLLTRIQFAVNVWAVKISAAFGLWIQYLRLVATAGTHPPNYIKRYPIRPSLRSRVFLPNTYRKGLKLPLYIDIHGGGFVMWDPWTDDEFCRLFADKFGYCVVSLDYRKAPSYRFPIPTQDCAELVRAVLADKDLPIDYDKVVLGGFSAGGNLSLGVAQFDDLKHKIKAVVPIYPVTDFTGKYRKYIGGREHPAVTMFSWAYMPAGIDRRQTLLSCVYATREMLPQKMYFVGAENDHLVAEAQVMAKKLAGVKEDADMGTEWNKNGVRWEMVLGQPHGFTHLPAPDSNAEMERKQICEKLYKRIGTWLKEEVFQN